LHLPQYQPHSPIFTNDSYADELERLPEGYKFIKGESYERGNNVYISAISHDEPGLSSNRLDNGFKKM
jgi:hypothetical protein